MLSDARRFRDDHAERADAERAAREKAEAEAKREREVANEHLAGRADAEKRLAEARAELARVREALRTIAAAKCGWASFYAASTLALIDGPEPSGEPDAPALAAEVK
jgi:hypothetical protein